MRRLTAVLSVLSVAVLGGAAHALPAAPPTFAESRTYFHCAATKVGNAGPLTGGLPSWNTTAPTASVQTGAGCGSTNTPGLAGAAGNYGTVYDALFSGTFTGNIKDLTLELHSIYAGAARADGNFGTGVSVLIDGVEYVLAATPAVVPAKPVPSSTRASEKVTFTLTGFGITEDKDRDGVADAGPGTVERTVVVKLRNFYLDSNPVGAFVYDTTEVPSGITFNPATRESVVAAVVKKG